MNEVIVYILMVNEVSHELCCALVLNYDTKWWLAKMGSLFMIHGREIFLSLLHLH